MCIRDRGVIMDLIQEISEYLQKGRAKKDVYKRQIPNTMVKPQTADGTMLEKAWESRWLPEHLIRTSRRCSSNLVTKGSDPAWCVTTLSESESHDEA